MLCRLFCPIKGCPREIIEYPLSLYTLTRHFFSTVFVTKGSEAALVWPSLPECVHTPLGTLHPKEGTGGGEEEVFKQAVSRRPQFIAGDFLPGSLGPWLLDLDGSGHPGPPPMWWGELEKGPP